VNESRIAILENPEDPRCQELAATLNLALVEAVEDSDMVLAFEGPRLEVRFLGARPFWVDFLGTAERRQQGSRRSHPLCRAVGRKLPLPRIVDATAGLGRDACVLAALGYEVVAVERCPILFALLENGLVRAADEAQISQRLSLIQGDARDYLQGCIPDVVYMDPMWPKRSKSALVKKEMQFFQRLLGEEQDAGSLFEVARAVARQRVVVKRPVKAPPLVPEPSYRVQGGRVRWDVYLASQVP
jgi:16S rRNA (guanine1516-N2)-methyltransferase